MKSCKISEENHIYLMGIGNSPNKALDIMRKKNIKSAEYNELLNMIHKFDKRVKCVEDFIEKHSGRY